MKIGVIGVGHMGSVLAKVLSESEMEVLICDHNQEKVDEAVNASSCFSSDAEKICLTCDAVVLGMRPQDEPTFLTSEKEVLAGRDDVLIVTMAAGVKCEQVQKAIGKAVPVMRIMPNTPVAVGFGAIPFCLKDVKDSHLVSEIVCALEKFAVVPEVEEGDMDAVCALSGSGPAFVYRFIESMAQAGKSCGLETKVAEQLAIQTVLGASMLAKNSGKTPHALAEAVCSPGGTTIEGVKVLDATDFSKTVVDAVKASCARSKELSGE